MKKILFLIGTIGFLSLGSACQKCYTCSGANVEFLNQDYCNTTVYSNADDMKKAEQTCIERQGTWTAK